MTLEGAQGRGLLTGSDRHSSGFRHFLGAMRTESCLEAYGEPFRHELAAMPRDGLRTHMMPAWVERERLRSDEV